MSLLVLLAVVLVCAILVVMLIDMVPGDPRLRLALKAVCIVLALVVILEHSGVL